MSAEFPAEVEVLRNRARPGIQSLAPYEPGKPIEELERELGLTDVIKLASNENPLGAGSLALAAATARLGEMERYPDGSGYQLKQALSRHHGLPESMITLGNGSNEVLDIVARVFAGPGDEIVFSAHCFVVYPIVTRIIGATPVQVPARAYGHDIEAMSAAITPATRLVFIANPNNPTGTWTEPAALKGLLDRAPRDCVIVVDEAYFEYAEGDSYPDATKWLGEYPNLVVTRTFSKAHGLASMRIGYALSHPAVADLMNRVRQPFNVNDPSMFAALAALEDRAHIERSVSMNRDGMQMLADGFDRLGLDYIPSIANFLTFDTGGNGAETYEALLRRGVIVRPIGGYGLPAHLRVTIGTEAENRRFLDALDVVLAKRQGSSR
ncbi:MAG: histidinol-phosphate transaminase [Pseudomonadota bacterium]